MKRILYVGLDPTEYVVETENQLIHWPLIHIQPRPLTDPIIQKALQNFEKYTHLVITSKSTVPILYNYVQQMGFASHIWQTKSLLAVGRVTDKHLSLFGLECLAVAQEETAEGVIATLKELPLTESYCFWPHSAQARPLLEQFFLEEKIRYCACALYDTVCNEPTFFPDWQSIDEIVFTSPSTVEAFLKIVGCFPSHVRLTSIGPITARYLEQHLLN